MVRQLEVGNERQLNSSVKLGGALLMHLHLQVAEKRFLEIVRYDRGLLVAPT